jgi:tetratricopeptide (TPR) repeat protein
MLERMAPFAESADVQEQTAYFAIGAATLRASGRLEEALEAAEKALVLSERLGLGVSVDAKVAYGEALASALALGRLDVVDGLIARIDAIPPGIRPPSLRALAARFTALGRAARGEHASAEQGFKTAEALLREHGLVFPLAVVLLEHGEWLHGQGRGADAEPLLAEARETFERLRARPWLERLDEASPSLAAVD